MLYAPAKELNEAEGRIYSEVKSCDLWWNEKVLELNFVIAKIISIASIATATPWSYKCPFIRQLRADTSYTLFGQQAGMAKTFQTR